MASHAHINPKRLTAFLQKKSQPAIKMSFKEIEEMLEENFPASARKYNAWWSNNPSNNPRTKGWLDTGYITSDLNLPDETVVFVKTTEI